MRTSELEGVMLDYWVAQAEGICLHDAPHTRECGNWGTDYTCTRCNKDASSRPNVATWHPSTDWSQAGPIIERERFVINGHSMRRMGFYVRHIVERKNRKGDAVFKSKYAIGDTPLVAAMRAYVASVYGDDVPDGDAAIRAAQEGGAHENR